MRQEYDTSANAIASAAKGDTDRESAAFACKKEASVRATDFLKTAS
jgi:hypothetical protein